MKPYNNSTRSMLKLGKYTTSLYNKLSDLSKQNYPKALKFNENALTLSFNEPAKAGIKFHIGVHLVDKCYQEIKAKTNGLTGAVNLSGVDKMMPMGMSLASMVGLDVERTAKILITKNGNSAEAAKL